MIPPATVEMTPYAVGQDIIWISSIYCITTPVRDLISVGRRSVPSKRTLRVFMKFWTEFLSKNLQKKQVFRETRLSDNYTLLYSFFWVILRLLNFTCRRFETLYQFHFHRLCKQKKSRITIRYLRTYLNLQHIATKAG